MSGVSKHKRFPGREMDKSFQKKILPKKIIVGNLNIWMARVSKYVEIPFSGCFQNSRDGSWTTNYESHNI